MSHQPRRDLRTSALVASRPPSVRPAEAGSSVASGWSPQWSGAVVEAIQTIDQLTAAENPIPMAEVPRLLGALKHVGYEFPFALQQLSRSLRVESHPEADGSQGQAPETAEARGHLAHAAQLASQFGVLLAAAELAIQTSESRRSVA